MSDVEDLPRRDARPDKPTREQEFVENLRMATGPVSMSPAGPANPRDYLIHRVKQLRHEAMQLEALARQLPMEMSHEAASAMIWLLCK